ncbi:MAG: UDP-N-acetylmuramate--L-alanine ligase [Bacteroidetes bacterium]|nr:MAG: UDP-N-acetylmuramate--L-alanine ligase [Bacteroidota bacterium]
MGKPHVYAEIKRVYLLGIGGIGMSALARYFHAKGLQVAGYDRTPSELTRTLEREGMAVHYADDVNLIPADFLTPSPESLIIYTPAIPGDMREKLFLLEAGHQLYKRAEVLGLISRAYTTLAVAGTHGKTTTSTMLAHMLSAARGCTAFLGGVSRSDNSNLILPKQHSDLLVAEADEFDRSFLHLTPQVTAVTSVSPDHLDIYGTPERLVETFRQFAGQNTSRRLIVQAEAACHFEGLDLDVCTYSASGQADYQAENISYNGLCHFTLSSPVSGRSRVTMRLGGKHNIENAVAAIAMAEQLGIPPADLLPALENFQGVKRRFEVYHVGARGVFIDDYAHHPDEIRATIRAVRTMFPTRHLTVIFQPHLYSRTRDFLAGFADALAGADSAILIPIYPAREEPILGIDSKLIIDRMPEGVRKVYTEKHLLADVLAREETDVVLSMGAGSIGELAPQLAEVIMLKEKA